jgi:hypothetical protein
MVRGRFPVKAGGQQRKLPSRRQARGVLLLILAIAGATLAQEKPVSVYPKEVRGYKVERARVEIKRSRAGAAGAEMTELVEIGAPRLAGVSPLGITLEVPIKVAAVEQSGLVEALAFEDVRINGTPVTIEDYEHPFALPEDAPITLPHPLRVFLSTPNAVLGALDELRNSKETWPVTGRIYVLGRYKKFLMKFKRAVPVELNTTVPNPLRDQPPARGAAQRRATRGQSLSIETNNVAQHARAIAGAVPM